MWILLAVTVEGKIYACGEATNGRLGLGLSSGTIPIPRQITALSNYVVKKVAVHSGGRHAMALTVDGKVFSWGEGDDGKLGHFSRMCVFQASRPIFRNTPFFCVNSAWN